MTMSIRRVESDCRAIGTVDVTLTRGGAIAPKVELPTSGTTATSCAPIGLDPTNARAFRML